VTSVLKCGGSQKLLCSRNDDHLEYLSPIKLFLHSTTSSTTVVECCCRPQHLERSQYNRTSRRNVRGIGRHMTRKRTRDLKRCIYVSEPQLEKRREHSLSFRLTSHRCDKAQLALPLTKYHPAQSTISTQSSPLMHSFIF
jgi:hypothetical protein